MSDPGAVRAQSDLSDVVELVLDKGVVINADIVVTVGDTELLGVRVRAAVASFDTAAEYGLEFPAGTDRDRVEQASDRPPLSDEGRRDRGADPAISVRPVHGESKDTGTDPYISARSTHDGTRDTQSTHGATTEETEAVEETDDAD